MVLAGGEDRELTGPKQTLVDMAVPDGRCLFFFLFGIWRAVEQSSDIADFDFRYILETKLGRGGTPRREYDAPKFLTTTRKNRLCLCEVMGLSHTRTPI